MEKEQSRKFYRKNRWVDVLAAITLLTVLAFSVLALRDYVKSRLLNFATVQEGSITITLPAEILVLRNEYVLTAPVAGEFVPQAEEGERVKEGAVVGYCGGVALAAPKSGVISYILDGWEEKLQIAAINDFDWQQVFALLQEEQEAAVAAASMDMLEPPEVNIAAQRPVARLVDNLLDYKAMLKLRDPRELLKEEKTLTFSQAEGKMFKIPISECDRWQYAGGDICYIFDMSSKEDSLFALRYSPVEVIAKEVRGIIIPTEAVWLDEEGRSGVYIQKKRKLVFAEITELTSKNGLSVVEGLDRTAVIVTNPAKATDGQRIY